MPENCPTPTQSPERRAELVAYIAALKAKRTELLTGAQSYSIGSRSLARYNASLTELNAAIRRAEADLAALDGHPKANMKQAIFRDW